MMSKKEGINMKFHIWRCLGIMLGGTALFLLGIMQTQAFYNREWVMFEIYPTYAMLGIGYFVVLFGASIFLSIEEEKEGY
jgi:hypothetical protein